MLKRPAFATSFLVFLLIAAVAPCRAADQWLEVKSAHFTVISNAGQWSARDMAWQLEQIRSALAALWPWAHVDLDRPFAVIAVKDEPSMRAIAPKYWEEKGSVHPISVWAIGGDGYYLAVRTDVKGEDNVNVNPYQNSYFSYVSLILSRSVPRPLPLWLSRGLSGVLSNTVVSQQKVLMGPPIPDYIRELRGIGGRLRIAELVSATGQSPVFRGDLGEWRFDVQAWALVHMLMFSDSGAHSTAFQRYVNAVLTGEDPDKAFREALGPPEALDGPMASYVARSIFSYIQLPLDASVKREAFPSRTLSIQESASVRALFHAAMRRPGDARTAIAEARKGANAPESYVAEAELLEREGKPDDAQAAYQHAVDGGSASSYAYRRLASLIWRHAPTHDELTQIATLVQKAIALNNRDDYAYAMLGEARSELGEHDGLGYVRRAISLAPQESYHHLSAARVLARERNFDEARKEVQAAQATARTDDERQHVSQLAQWLETASRGGGQD
jgi:tetratricopeptide (TPR) repeat protein